VAPRRSRRSAKQKRQETAPEERIQGAPLKPIRVVERVLTRPDGTQLRVKVPVYPPFRLQERPAPKEDPRKRKAS
jgi:hypothetical protein